MKLTKTETKILDRLNRHGELEVSTRSECKAARSLEKKGLVQILSYGISVDSKSCGRYEIYGWVCFALVTK